MLKKRLIRIIVGAVIYAAAILIDIFAGINHWIVFGIFLVSFLIIGGDVIWKALRNIARGRIFDENFLMLIATSKLDDVENVSISFMTTKMVLKADEDKMDAVIAESEKIIKKIEPDVVMKPKA